MIVGCEPPTDVRLKVENRTNRVIYARFEQDNTLSRSENIIGYAHPTDKIKPHEITPFLQIGSNNAWEYFINSSKDSTMHLFIFYEDTLIKYSIAEIIEQNKFARKYDLKVNHLDAMNWTVIFIDGHN